MANLHIIPLTESSKTKKNFASSLAALKIQKYNLSSANITWNVYLIKCQCEAKRWNVAVHSSSCLSLYVLTRTICMLYRKNFNALLRTEFLLFTRTNTSKHTLWRWMNQKVGFFNKTQIRYLHAYYRSKNSQWSSVAKTFGSESSK